MCALPAAATRAVSTALAGAGLYRHSTVSQNRQQHSLLTSQVEQMRAAEKATDADCMKTVALLLLTRAAAAG